uniref:Tetraspanin 32 n=1 Tax=Dromaius novaehollandiae TaxID=8790 RepID=A0A8C4KA56_DRONO
MGLSIATLSTVTHGGLHFARISNIAFESNSYRVIHNAGMLRLRPGETLGEPRIRKTSRTCRRKIPREGRGFFCFALAFCGLIPAAFWRYTHRTEVEDSMMDVYDFVYEEVRKNASSFRRQELIAIHETFLCCGKRSPFGETGDVERKTCPPGHAGAAEEVKRKSVLPPCLLHVQRLCDITGTCLISKTCWTSQVYGMILTSFLYFSIHFSNNLDRKGKYTLRER